MSRFKLLLIPIALVFLIPTANAQALDYFNSYPATGAIPQPGTEFVTVIDTFGTMGTILGAPSKFMVSASVNEPEFIAPLSSLTCYDVLEPVSGPLQVQVTHQVGPDITGPGATPELINLGATAQLCVPTQAALDAGSPDASADGGSRSGALNGAPTIDSYLCYAAEGDPLELPVSVLDPFIQQTPILGDPQVLCAPAGVNGQPVLNATEHLACYNYDTEILIGPGFVPITNLFHPPPEGDLLELDPSNALCLPSTVEIVGAEGLDHFSAYPVLLDQDTVGAPLELTDQFTTEVHAPGLLTRFLVPADKLGEGIIDPVSHLSCHELGDSLFDPPDVFATNQFGQQRFNLGPAMAACAPTQRLGPPDAPPVSIDYFKCYGATGTGPGNIIQWVDAFQSAPVTVIEPFMFCNPAAANGGVIQNPEEHLACFVTTPAGFPPAPLGVSIQSTLLPPIEILVTPPEVFCLPSQKEIVQPGQIFIVKNTVPDSGVDFAFSTTGGLSPAGFSLDDDDDETLANARSFTVADGSYTVTETPHPDYTTTVACVDPDGGSSTQNATATIDLDPGETVTCTFTNTVKPGRIVIVKDTVPDDAQDFSFSTTGGLSPSEFLLDDDPAPPLSNTLTFTSVAPGPYSVTEAATAGYNTKVSCVDPDGGSSTEEMTATIDLDPGETVTCTFTNTLDGYTGLDHFSVYPATGVNGPAIPIPITDQFGTADHVLGGLFQFLYPADKNNEGIIDPGSHLSCFTISDPADDPGVVLASNQFGDQRLDLGQPMAACLPTQILIQPGGEAGSPSGGPAGIDYFKCYEASGAVLDTEILWSDSVQNDAQVTLAEPYMFCNPASVDGGEPQNPVGHLACFVANPTGFVVSPPLPGPLVFSPMIGPFTPQILPPEAFCVPSEKQVIPPGEIVIIKDTVPDDGQDFSFTTTGGLNPATFSLDDDDDGTLFNVQNYSVADGTYTVTEAVHPGYDTKVSCVDTDGGSSSQEMTATIDLDPGETVTCTFTNTAKPGTIVIVKDTIPNGEQDFTFTTTGGLSPAQFDLDDDNDGTLSDTQTFEEVAAGTYTVSEKGHPGYETSVKCVDPDGGSNTTDGGATIDLDSEETVTCTFTNTARPGTIVIVKDTVPDDGQNFSFTTTGGLSPATFDLDDDGDFGELGDDEDIPLPNTQTYTKVAAGSYTVTEAAASGYFTSVTCDDPDGGSNGSGATATIDLDPGETVTCTFRNAFNEIFSSGFELTCDVGIEVSLALANPDDDVVAGEELALKVTVQNHGLTAETITSLIVTIDGAQTDIIDLLPSTVLAPGEVVVIEQSVPTSDSDDAVYATVSLMAESRCGFTEADSGITVPLCTLGDIDIEVRLGEQNHAGIQFLAGSTLVVSVANIGVTEFTFSDLTIVIHDIPESLIDRLPVPGLLPGESVEVEYEYYDEDGLGFVSGEASVEADGSCGPPINAEDVFDFPLNPD